MKLLSNATVGAFRRTAGGRLAVILSTIALSLATIPGCSTTNEKKIDTRTLEQLFIHFKKCGLHVEKSFPVEYRAVLASDGIVSVVNGVQVEVYVYDQNDKIQNDKLEKIKKKGTINVLAVPVPAVVNGHFVMMTYSRHPDKYKVVEAFKSF